MSRFLDKIAEVPRLRVIKPSAEVTAPEVLPPEQALPEASARPASILAPSAPQTGTPIYPVARRIKVRPASLVQDGNSHGEQLVLETLWTHPEAVILPGNRRQITIGYRNLSDACGLAVNRCKENLRGLREKLALEIDAVNTYTTGTTYIVYSFEEILKRRAAAGMTHVVRNRGTYFVDPNTGQPLPTAPRAGTPVYQTGTPQTAGSGVPLSDQTGVPETDAYLKNLSEEGNKEELCPRCRTSSWREKDGVRICGLCDLPEMAAFRAAHMRKLWR